MGSHIPIKYFLYLTGVSLPIGKGRIMRRPGGIGANGEANNRGRSRSDRIAILSIGTRLHEALISANDVEAMNPSIGVTVADARFMKPLDHDLIRELVDENSVLITIEEGSVGGFGDHVLHFLSNDGALDEGNLKYRSMVLPDELFEAGTQQEQYDAAGLNNEHLTELIQQLTTKQIKVPVPATELVEEQL